MSDQVNVEIDGKKVKVAQGAMIIEAADNNGVYIPRFCYHKKLTVAANCRMCLVEVEKNKKPVPACATPVTEGMKILTRSELARNAQKAVMEFLLINHPLDCPICDQGGECELQDLAMGFGRSESRYEESKRVVKDKNLGPLINTEMTRCIYCTRCIRFGTEIAGLPQLGTMGRGEHTEVSTFVEQAITSEISGNIIDLCPVGALTSKPFKFSARAWELQQRPAIAPHDCVGSNINIHALRGVVKRVVPKSNEAINEVWLSDRDRFSYEAVNSDKRVTKPLLKRDGQWQEVDWTTALEIIASSLENVKNTYGADQIAAMVSANSTLEEQFLLQKLLRAFGSNNIDHRLQQTDFRDQASSPTYPQLGLTINDLERLDTALLIGSDIQREQPLLAARFYKAMRNGAEFMVINPYDFDFSFLPQTKIISAPAQMVHDLAAILKVVAADKSLPPAVAKLVAEVKSHTKAEQIAAQLQKVKHKAIILGALAQNSTHAAELRLLAQQIASLVGASYGELTYGANAAGAWLAGCVPHRTVAGATVPLPGKDVQSFINDPHRAYLLFNIEPEFDMAQPYQAIQTLQHADFVVSCAPFATAAMYQYADVILPIATFAETSGTFINCNGIWQSFNGAVLPVGETRPGWKVLRVLGNFLHLPGFEYNSAEEIRSEIQQQVHNIPRVTGQSFMIEKLPTLPKLSLVSYWPMYRSDNIVRHSAALQAAFALQKHNTLRISSLLAASLELATGDQVQLTQDQQMICIPVEVDEKVAPAVLYLAVANHQSAQLTNVFGNVTIKKIES